MISGGDEARVARAGSGRGESSFANGTPSSRALPPRAGWAVRQQSNATTVSSSPLLPEQAAFGTSTGINNHNNNNSRTNSSAGQSSSCLGQWTSDNNKSRAQQRSPLSNRVVKKTTTTTVGLSSSEKSFLEQSSNLHQQNSSLSTVEFSPIASVGTSSSLASSGLSLQQNTNVLGSRQNQSNNHFHVDKIATNRTGGGGGGGGAAGGAGGGGGGGGSHWHERLELRGDVLSMSQNALSPPSRPPSSASSASNTSTTNNLPRVHTSTLSYGGHDHTRPLPPPRLPEAISSTGITTISSSSISSLTIAPLTAPLTPLATSASFRSNNSRTSTSAGVAVGSTSTTTTSNNNININNNNNNNNNNNINNSTTTTTHHVQPNIVDSIGVVVPANSSSLNNSTNSTSQSRTTSTTNSSGVVVVGGGGGGGDAGSRGGGGGGGGGGPLGEVTLTVPRPDGERAVNEYVETPFRQTNATATNLVCNLVASNQKCLKNERRLHHHHHHHHHNHHHHQNNHNHQHHQQIQQNQQQQQHLQSIAQSKNPSTASLVTAHARNQENSGSIRRHQSHLLQSSLSVTSPSSAVTKQPVSFTKEPANALGSGSLVGTTGGRLNDPSLSIMCDFCGRCRCESCREPPPLPSRWLCDNSCFCSAETALDYASCLCCVKGLFYHCADSGSGTDSEAGGNCADEPCSCTGPRRTARWACLGALTFVLPCLLCYWPLKGCVAMCEACYARHAAQGCRCDPNAHGRHHAASGGATSVVSRDSRDPEKRLLDPVTPEL